MNPEPSTADRQSPHVRVEVRGAVGHVTLDRPEALNALSHDMIRAVSGALARWAVDPAVRVVLLTGEGSRGFCAGGDVRAAREWVLACHPERFLTFLRDEYRMDAQVAEFPKPVVAVMDGVTMGGGIGLTAHASVRVVTERSRLAMPETRIGFCPDVGGTYLLSRAPGLTGVHVGMSATTVDAADAIYLGLADAFVPVERLGLLVERVVADDGAHPASVVADLAAIPSEPRLARERGWIDACYAAPSAVEVVRCLEGHADPAARAAGVSLRALSPTAVAVAHAAIRRASGRSLREALELELAIGAGLVGEPDLVEGIRAQLVDKDRSPRWCPARLEDVDPGVVARVLGTALPDRLW